MTDLIIILNFKISEKTFRKSTRLCSIHTIIGQHILKFLPRSI